MEKNNITATPALFLLPAINGAPLVITKDLITEEQMIKAMRDTISICLN